MNSTTRRAIGPFLALLLTGVACDDVTDPDCSHSALGCTDYSSYLNWVASVRVPGGAPGVAPVGDFLYVADGDLHVYANTGSAPQLLGTLELPTSSSVVTADGTHAYLVTASRLYVADVGTPTAPALVGSIATSGRSQSVVVAGGYAYVADHRLLVFDVLNPAAPMLLRAIDVPDTLEAVTLSGNHLYLAAGHAGLVVADLQDAAQPVIIASVDTPRHAKDIGIADGHAYVADGSSLQVFDISTPASPRLVGSVRGDYWNVAVSDGFACVARFWDGIFVLDIHDPAVPRQVGSFKDPQYAYNVVASGDRIYVSTSNLGFASTVHVLDATSPREAPQFRVHRTMGGTFAASEKYAYMVGTDQLQILEVGEECAEVTTWLRLRGRAEGIAVAGNLAYVAGPGEGGWLQVIDLGYPGFRSNPRLLGTVSGLGRTFRWVRVSGNYVYVTDMDVGLRVVDVSNPASPQLVASVDTPGEASGVFVQDNHAYLATWSAGVLVMDVTDPAAPQVIATIDVPTASYVTLAGNILYVGAHGGLYVIDVAVPSAPVMLATLQLPGYGVDVAVAGNHAYAASGMSHAFVIDIRSPSAPRIVGMVGGIERAYLVGVAGDRVFLGGSGFTTAPLQCD